MAKRAPKPESVPEVLTAEAADERSPEDPIATDAEAAVGRPKGSRNRDRLEAVMLPAACPTCKSTRREPFRDGPASEMSATVEIDGRTYNRQIWRNTRCRDCGQFYRVIEYRFEPDPKPKGKP